MKAIENSLCWKSHIGKVKSLKDKKIKLSVAGSLIGVSFLMIGNLMFVILIYLYDYSSNYDFLGIDANLLCVFMKVKYWYFYEYRKVAL